MIEQTLNAVTQPGFIASIVLCDLVEVLETNYGYKRVQIEETLQHLFEVDRVRLQSSALARRTLAAYRTSADFADALLALVNERAGSDHTASFDKRAAGLEQIRLLSQ